MCKDYKDETIRLLEIIIAGMERLGQPLTSDANDIDSVAQERNRIASETLTILGRAGDNTREAATKPNPKYIHLKSVETFRVKGRGLIFNVDQAEYDNIQFAVGDFVNHDGCSYEVRGIESRGGIAANGYIGLVVSAPEGALPPHDTGDPENPCRCYIARVHGSANTSNQFMVRACIDERTPPICIHCDGTIVNKKELFPNQEAGG